ncbi:MAG: NADH-quinone oxidoreductase subunit J [Candidatus Thermoplasmatota archaeon]|jgi:NADH:ubiquinone oxidoreductase subunit 6 (subunit J)|nr:NADH-quinone oxidoreductase subunit J [Candidatus Thermoplasmatota archaeon]MCL5790043.1 NADH-quinone oxidoreductase subunit J [Candidatus Thermoplasmatota archaeon]
MRNKLALVLSVLLFLIMLSFIQVGVFPNGIVPINTGTPTSPGITQSLFTTYLLPFEIVTFLLVAAMLGAMYIGERGENK